MNPTLDRVLRLAMQKLGAKRVRDKHSSRSKRASPMILEFFLHGGVKREKEIVADGEVSSAATIQVM